MDPQAAQQLFSGMDFNPEMWDRLMRLMQAIREGSASMGNQQDMAIMQNAPAVTYRDLARRSQGNFERQANPIQGFMDALRGNLSSPSPGMGAHPSPGQAMATPPQRRTSPYGR